MSRRLEGNVAIITGAGTGIGEAIAHKFAKEGANVVVNGLPDDPAFDVAESIKQYGGQAIAYGGDVAEENHAQACVKTAIDHYGRLDILVNNAGVFLATGETQDYPIEAFDSRCVKNPKENYVSITHLKG